MGKSLGSRKIEVNCSCNKLQDITRIMITKKLFFHKIYQDFIHNLKKLSPLEMFYWTAFSILILYIAIQFKFPLFGIIIIFFLFFGIIAFEKKEIPFTVISLVFVLMAYNAQNNNFILEHGCYLE